MIAALAYDEPFPIGTILVPPVRLAAGKLYFRPAGPLRFCRGQPERLIFDFARLSEAPDRAFLEFARVWGVLGICRHGDLVHHQTPPCLPHRLGDEFVEPIPKWRNRALMVRATLNIKAALKRERLGDPADWKLIWPGKVPDQAKTAAEYLAIVASTLLSKANVQPILQCVEGRLTITFIGGNFEKLLKAMSTSGENEPWLSASGTLLAEIAVRTALTLQEGPGWATCSNPECLHLFRPRRHAAEGRLHFCPNCGKRASWRLSKRRRSAIRDQTN
jgi:hypothetical protein